MNKFEALKSLGYNYISRDEKNFYGNETIRAWVYKPSGMLYNDYIEEIGGYITYYIFQESISGIQNNIYGIFSNSNLYDFSEFKIIKPGTCIKLPNVRKNSSKLSAIKELGLHYVTRDEKGLLCAFRNRPVRINGKMLDDNDYFYGEWCVDPDDGHEFKLLHIIDDNNYFKNLKWKDEPLFIK